MGKGRFLNQKLGKRTSRRMGLLKSGTRAAQPGSPPLSPEAKFPKKGPSRSGGQGKG